MRMIPTFRPDAAHALLADPPKWNAWADRLEPAIEDIDSLLDALGRAYGRFAELGGRASDHGFAVLPDVPRDPAAADAAVRRVRAGGTATAVEREAVMLEVVAHAARLAFADEGVLQLHLGPMRDVSPRLRAEVGRDAGGDAIGDARQGPGLARFLGDLERDGFLPRTILYNANPADNALFAVDGRRVLAARRCRPWCSGGRRGGSTTTSRRHAATARRPRPTSGSSPGSSAWSPTRASILSMTRHELFRRVLCDAIGRDVDAGRIPRDMDLCAAVVRDVCVGNAVRYFALPASLVA